MPWSCKSSQLWTTLWPLNWNNILIGMLLYSFPIHIYSYFVQKIQKKTFYFHRFLDKIRSSVAVCAGLKWTWDAVFPGWTWIFSGFETTSFKTAKSNWDFSRFKSGFVNLPFFQVQTQFQIVLNLDFKPGKSLVSNLDFKWPVANWENN